MATLREHIDEHYEGNVAKYAQCHGKHRQQIHTWIAAGAVVVEGKVHLPATTRGKSDE